jgi:hypothetical protein
MFKKGNFWISIKSSLKNPTEINFMNIDKIKEVISEIYYRVQGNPYELEHLLVLDEQKPEIIFKVCKNSTYPYQMFDEYYFNNNFRINRHNIVIPEAIIKKICTHNSHNGISVLEYRDYTGKAICDMSKSDYITAIAIHELSHVFQLYIQDYYTEEDHTAEFYDVLEGFYCSNLVSDMELSLRKIL